MKKKFDLRYLKRALYIISKIEELSGNEAYIVGGAVRDYILNEYTKDFDIAINVLSSKVYHSRFFKENFKLISFSKYYKTLRVIDKMTGIKFEFTPMRRENYIKKFNPKIKFVDSPEIDVLRRDFTINALYMDKNMKILDFKNGVRDIRCGVVKLVQNKEKKIIQDPKRYLRAIKFVNKYELKLDKHTFVILKNARKCLELVSDEYKSEIIYNFIQNISVNGVRIIKNLNLYSFNSYNSIFNNINNLRKIEIPVMRIIGFFIIDRFDKLKIKDYNNIFIFKNRKTKLLFNDLVFYLERMSIDFYETILYVLDKYGFSILKDFYYLCTILNDSYILSIKIDKFSKIIHNIERGRLPMNRREININGEDLLKIGYKSGPQIGEIIRTLNVLVLKGEKNEKDNLMRLALKFKSQRR